MQCVTFLFGFFFSGDDNNTSTSSRHEENDMSSTGLYRLEIVGIELLSLYGTEVCSYNSCHLADANSSVSFIIFSHGVTVR